MLRQEPAPESSNSAESFDHRDPSPREPSSRVQFYDSDHIFTPNSGAYDTRFEIADNDTFTEAANHNKPCCLNFASHKRPGGGYRAVMNLRKPIKTQEEDLFRRSDLPGIMDTDEVRKYYRV